MAVPILIIVDDAPTLSYLAAAVDQEGLEVRTCADPEEGIAVVREWLRESYCATWSCPG